MRSLVLDYDKLHFVSQVRPKSSFAKQKTEYDLRQDEGFNTLEEEFQKTRATTEHNAHMYKNFIDKDEGLAVVKHEDDPTEINT